MYERHGDWESPEYVVWSSIKYRCQNIEGSQYADYGGRGITMAAAWAASYPAFLAAVGRRPSPDHSLDRYPDNNGNYEPGNVRWATRKEQCRNRRSSVYIEFEGESRTLSEWCEITGLEYQTLYRRLSMGWTVEEALTTSVHRGDIPTSQHPQYTRGWKDAIKEVETLINGLVERRSSVV